MARRRHETGLKKQQRIEREQRGLNAPDRYAEPADRGPEPVHPEPVPPGATQMFENTAPPVMAPTPDK